MITGVYYILNNHNHRIYIGVSKNVEQRLINHRHQLNRGTHINKALQADWNEYGASAFTLTLLLEHEVDTLRFRTPLAWLYDMERFWIRFYHANQLEYGYNCDQRQKSLTIWKRIRAKQTAN